MDCIILFYIQTQSHLASASRPDSELRRTIIDLEIMKYSYTFIHVSDRTFSCNQNRLISPSLWAIVYNSPFEMWSLKSIL